MLYHLLYKSKYNRITLNKRKSLCVKISLYIVVAFFHVYRKITQCHHIKNHHGHWIHILIIWVKVSACLKALVDLFWVEEGLIFLYIPNEINLPLISVILIQVVHSGQFIRFNGLLRDNYIPRVDAWVAAVMRLKLIYAI